jgi:Ca-activated chloride channel family protein
VSWLALSPLQVLGLWLGAAAVALWLYLHQRPMRRRVSTLRFWADLPPSVYRRRRWLREPWALLAQILFLLFLILALANPRWGNVIESRRVVLVVDASILSQVQPRGESRWVDRLRQDADGFLNALPRADDVLLLRAEADALPLVSFSNDRVAQRRAVAELRPSGGISDIPRALEAGRAALAGSRRALLVYIGPGMVDQRQSQKIDEFRQELGPADGSGDHPQFLVRLVGAGEAITNHGITRLALQRDSTQPEHWHLLTQLKNYSSATANLVLKFSIAGQPLLQRSVSLAPGQLAALNDEFTTAQGGLLEAQITPADDLQADDRAIVYVPAFRAVRVAVFTSRKTFEDDLRPVLAVNPYLKVDFLRPGGTVNPPADVSIYDSSAAPAAPSSNSIYFVRGQGKIAGRPIRVTDWNPQHAATRWVRTRDVSVRNAAVLDVRPTDTVLASGEGHPQIPLIVAREQNHRRMLVVGFDPHDSNFPQQSAFPLLIAGSVEWLTHPIEDVSDSLSSGELDLPGPGTRVLSPTGAELPFARNGSSLHILALDTGLYRVIGANRTTTFAVNAPPLLPSQRIEVTDAEKSTVQSEAIPYQGNYLWRILAILAILALWAEWWLFYSPRLNQHAVRVQERHRDTGEKERPIAVERSPEHDDALDPNFIT